MSIDSLAPCSGAHAVQSAAFALEWANPLQLDALTKTFSEYHQSGSELRKQLPSPPQEQKQLSLRIDQAPGITVPPTVASSGELIGYLFSKPLDAVSPARLLQINRNTYLHVIHDYTRWNPVLSDVTRLIESLANTLVSSPITSIGLQYTDVFHWRDDPENLIYSEILNRDSGLFASHIVDSKCLWHSHHGYMEKVTEPPDGNLLNNVNIDIIENGGQRSIAILTSHRLQLARPIYNPQELSTSSKAAYELLHKKNKELLLKLLQPEVRKKIKLESGSQ